MTVDYGESFRHRKKSENIYRNGVEDESTLQMGIKLFRRGFKFK